MTLAGIQLCSGSLHRSDEGVECIDLLDGIHLFEPFVFQQAKSSNTEESMEDVNHVTWPVCNATHAWILKIVGKKGD